MGVSHAQRTVVAAAVTNVLKVEYCQVPSSKVPFSKIRDQFVCPEFSSLHWDKKIVAVGRDGKSDCVCVIIRGVGSDKVELEKVISVPEVRDGSGKSEADAVIEALQEANFSSQIKSLCYDITATNTSADVGACKFLELLCSSCQVHSLDRVPAPCIRASRHGCI